MLRLTPACTSHRKWLAKTSSFRSHRRSKRRCTCKWRCEKCKGRICNVRVLKWSLKWSTRCLQVGASWNWCKEWWCFPWSCYKWESLCVERGCSNCYSGAGPCNLFDQKLADRTLPMPQLLEHVWGEGNQLPSWFRGYFAGMIFVVALSWLHSLELGVNKIR